MPDERRRGRGRLRPLRRSFGSETARRAAWAPPRVRHRRRRGRAASC